MECPEQEVIEHYIQGQLTSEMLTDFEVHLKTCRACKTRVREAEENERFLIELRTSERTRSEPPELNKTEIATVDHAQKLLGERYRVIRKIGEGAAGHVFQVADTVLDRLVAVKFLRKKVSTNDTASKRWHEARLMSQLNHPGIAQVYEIGEIEEHRFIVMEWVDGLPLTDAWKDLPLEQRLNIFLSVLNAVSAAHSRGIIHRDIKPSNILVRSDHKPKILDFGIALETSSLVDLETAVYRGTPAYSAPEQISLPVSVSQATDVFALGILLYQLLTDTLPYCHLQIHDLFDAIRTQHPELPNAIAEKVPIPLQNICLKALEKEPGKRYSDARALSDDINRYCRGERVWSRPSFLMDKIQQEVFYHRQKLKVWRDNDLLTEAEHDKLERIYENVVAPPDPSIIEARKLSASQVCLYLGGWISVLGSFVLFFGKWNEIPVTLRPVPAIFVTLFMAALGLSMWWKKESRLAVGFLVTSNLLIPITLLLMLGQWGILNPTLHPWGIESIQHWLNSGESLDEQESSADGRNEQVQATFIVGNRQVFMSSVFLLIASLLFLLITRSSIFALLATLAYLVLLSVFYVVWGMLGDEIHARWTIDSIAGYYLLPGVGLLAIGIIVDRHALAHYAISPSLVGLIVIIASLSAMAFSENTLFGWLGISHAENLLSGAERCGLSLIANGMIYLSLARFCRRMGTVLQRRIAVILNWLGPLNILGPLRMLDLDHMDVIYAPVYRVLLPIGSVAFVSLSVPRQMKSFFFSGSAGVAASIQRFTSKHLSSYFAWPVSLIIIGTICMLLSLLIPRLKANKRLETKKG